MVVVDDKVISGQFMPAWSVWPVIPCPIPRSYTSPTDLRREAEMAGS